MGVRLKRQPETPSAPASVRISTSPARIKSLIQEYKKAGFTVKNVDKVSVYTMGRGDLMSFTVIPPVKQDTVG